MEELLKELGINETEDFESIREELENKQTEYLERLDNASDENRRKQLKETLTKIEMALAHVSWMIEKIGKGLVVEGSGDSGESEDKTEERKDFTSLKGKSQGNNPGMKDLSSVLGNTMPPSGQSTYPATSQQSTLPMGAAVSGTNGNHGGIPPKLQRAFICLEENDWDKADSLLEDVLNDDPTNSKAYIGKLMAELHIAKENKIREYSSSIKNLNNFKLALKYAGSDYANTIRGYNEYIEKTIAYKAALKDMLSASSELEYNRAESLFDKLGSFQDAASRAEECRRMSQKIDQAKKQRKLDDLEKLYQQAVSKMKQHNYFSTHSAISEFKVLKNYKDAPLLLRQCEDELTELNYVDALEKMNSESSDSQRKALELFKELGNYKDSKKKREECELRIHKILQKEEEHIKKYKIIRKTKKVVVTFLIIFCIIMCKIIYLWSCVDSEGTLKSYKWSFGYEVIPNSVLGKKITSIGPKAFYNNKMLLKVIVAEGVVSIKDSAFEDCSNLIEVDLPDSLKELGSYAFAQSGIKKIMVPAVAEMGSTPFDNCENLSRVVFANGTKKIDFDYFHGSTSLTEIIFPEGLEDIDVGFFVGLNNLEEITFPRSLTNIRGDVDQLRYLNAKIFVYRDSEAAKFFAGDPRIIYID